MHATLFCSELSAATLALADSVPQAWKTSWTWIWAIGIGAFFLLVLVLIPLGLRDLRRLFAHLERGRFDPPDEG